MSFCNVILQSVILQSVILQSVVLQSADLQSVVRLKDVAQAEAPDSDKRTKFLQPGYRFSNLFTVIFSSVTGFQERSLI
jgi:hypothetical protein